MRKPKPRLSHLSDFVDACLGPSLAAQGFATSDVLLAWEDIVGERLATFTQPLKIEWKRKSPGADPDARPEPATLVVRVESAFALEMQHLAPVAIERVNAYYGWRCIGRIVLKQGPVRRALPERRAAFSIDEEDKRQVKAAVEPIAEEGLRTALGRLGEAVIGTSSRKKRTKA